MDPTVDSIVGIINALHGLAQRTACSMPYPSTLAICPPISVLSVILDIGLTTDQDREMVAYQLLRELNG